ncbi:OLC1v1000658C1 [Oldenlandia corymbosa var. corymbosa]|uniref:OLC1v1000658C1 n=1 Tax=Oldenlandia corymbosa var. corymbosa TaxID=529605 RepID=A0AAV1D4Y1_OLDCO|nr:OLC1v1000658C1 [Oldenlandia corymbosa var. corymbosa]
MEFEGKQLQEIKEAIGEEMVKLERRAKDVEEKDEKSATLLKEIELREKIMGSKNLELVAKEEQLQVLKDLLDLREKNSMVDFAVNVDSQIKSIAELDPENPCESVLLGNKICGRDVLLEKANSSPKMSGRDSPENAENSQSCKRRKSSRETKGKPPDRLV